LRLSKKWQSHFFEKDAACCSALIIRWERTIRTFAGRDVFSPTHMSPEKTNLIFSRLWARTLRGFFDKLKWGAAKAEPHFVICYGSDHNLPPENPCTFLGKDVPTGMKMWYDMN